MATEPFSYDVDGNMTVDAERQYGWDDENRLFWVAPKNPAAGDVAWQYVYDYMGRRVRKYAYDWDANIHRGAGGWPVNPQTFTADIC